MDKNSVIGLLLIGAIFIGFTYLNKPTEAELAAARKERIQADSIAKINENQTTIDISPELSETLEQDSSEVAKQDSIKNLEMAFLYGRFANSGVGKTEYITIENELIKAKISNKGGRLVNVQLKEYQTHDSLPVYLFDEDSSQFAPPLRKVIVFGL